MGMPGRLPPLALSLLEDAGNDVFFSAGSIWEVSIKNAIGRPDFNVDPRLLRRALVEAGYVEIPITGAHAASVDVLPMIHKDPFDRMLVAQAIADDLTLITSDPLVARYPGPIRLVLPTRSP